MDFWQIFGALKSLEGSTLYEKLGMAISLWLLIRRDLRKGDAEVKNRLLKLENNIKEIRVHVGLDEKEGA
jgi:hypothetical protein